ncbi:uncharacterized protein LOC131321342 [Rhododendron vialii]|uniref:uncharacterized protein LOC131321342 n=1 Tax=Rhododendron vialii TaxID=182163 RepID=UPI00265F926C|nr:uncharacterized protein LOC131321342 [Rhododendron vialii]
MDTVRVDVLNDHIGVEEEEDYRDAFSNDDDDMIDVQTSGDELPDEDDMSFYGCFKSTSSILQNKMVATCFPMMLITDVCSACFEQRTVFTQQVLAKALNQMVDQTPLPLLFMSTVIQAIDVFPSLIAQQSMVIIWCMEIQYWSRR